MASRTDPEGTILAFEMSFDVIIMVTVVSTTTAYKWLVINLILIPILAVVIESGE